MRKPKVSSKPFLRVAQAQINPTVGDFDANRELIWDAYLRAKEMGSDLVLFPELALCGYPPEDLVYRRVFFEKDRRSLLDLARRVTGPALVVGCLNRGAGKTEGCLYNSAAVLSQKRIAGFYDKICLPNYGVFDEERYFDTGRSILILTTARGHFRVGLSICEDIWIPGSPLLSAMKVCRPDLLVNLSASPFYSGKIHQRAKVIRDAAKSVGCHLAYTNLVGGQDELVFDGRSLWVDPRGKILTAARAFEEDLLIYDLPVTARKPDAVSRAGMGKNLAGFSVKRVKLRVGNTQAAAVRGAPARLKLPIPNAIEEIYRALALSLADYTRKNGFKKVVLGMSGGIDSAVVGAIAAKVMGAAHCLFVTMPSHITGQATLSDAKRLAENLGVRIHEIPIAKMYQTVMKHLSPVFGAGNIPGLAEENLQARLRGLVLMTLSNKQGHLVLTTGNKSEMATGYCTLYGDMAGGFALIKDVPKMTVYALAEYINRSHGSEVIPASIIKRPPTAELKENQKDEDSLPPYPVLDDILRDYVEGHQSLAHILKKKKYSVETVKRVLSLVDRSEYKRRQAPLGTKITPLAFGRDRRMPVTNRFTE